MANEFDKYREALVMEQRTIWPTEYDNLSPDSKSRIEELLHASPADAANLEYIRQHSGFRREIAVTESDLARLGINLPSGAAS